MCVASAGTYHVVAPPLVCFKYEARGKHRHCLETSCVARTNGHHLEVPQQRVIFSLARKGTTQFDHLEPKDRKTARESVVATIALAMSTVRGAANNHAKVTPHRAEQYHQYQPKQRI
jgi:hypothetical protein